MSNPDLLPLGLALLAGVALGTAYFCGLWLTVCRLSRTPAPRRLYGLSLLLRLGLALGGFFLLARQGTAALLAGGAGFLLARQLWLLGKRKPAQRPTEGGDGGE